MVRSISLNKRWCPSAPVVVGNRVVYTPSEEPILVCVNLLDGSKIWERPKADFLYLAGVFKNRVLLVGETSVVAMNLEDGKTLWSQPIPENAGLPSGVGIAGGDRYYLPLSSGELWSLNLTDGNIVTKSVLPSDSHPLGNLVMHQGMLLSLTPQAITSFELRKSLQKKISRRKAKNSTDAWALLREADIFRT